MRVVYPTVDSVPDGMILSFIDTTLPQVRFLCVEVTAWCGLTDDRHSAPQCPFPDAYIGTTLNAFGFDAVYVQFCTCLSDWMRLAC